MDVWTVIELGVGIVCACIPTMRPIYTRTIFEASSRKRQAEATNETCDTYMADPTLTLHHKRSIPSQSVHFAHLGVLGDTIQGKIT